MGNDDKGKIPAPRKEGQRGGDPKNPQNRMTIARLKSQDDKGKGKH